MKRDLIPTEADLKFWDKREWRRAVQAEETVLGYDEWVIHQLESETRDVALRIYRSETKPQEAYVYFCADGKVNLDDEQSIDILLGTDGLLYCCLGPEDAHTTIEDMEPDNDMMPVCAVTFASSVDQSPSASDNK